MSEALIAALGEGGLTIDHIGIVVPDLGAAIAFYRDALGCAIGATVRLEEHDIEVSFVDFANARIELIAPLGRHAPPRTLLGDHTSADFLARSPQGGLHHVCYLVPDLAAALARLGAMGVKPLGTGRPEIGASGKPIIFLDPATTGGTLVELKQAG